MKRIVSVVISLIIIVTSLSCGLTALADDNTNLMLGATFTANDAYYNGWYPDNRPLSKLNDGNTYVGVGYNGGNVATIPMETDGTGFVNANFASSTTVNKIVLYFAGISAGIAAENVTRDFAIDVKLENGIWTRVAEQHLDAWTNWDAKKVTLCFDAVAVTDIRLKIKNHASSAIYEIEAFYDSTQTSASNTPIISNDYTADAIPMPEHSNLLPTTTITANSEHYDGWYDVNRPISRLIDGEKAVSYNAGKLMVTPYAPNGQACINFAFSKATFVNKVVVYLPGTTNGVPTTNQVLDYENHTVYVTVKAAVSDKIEVQIFGEKLIHDNSDVEAKWMDILQRAQLGYMRKNEIAKHLRTNMNKHLKLALIAGQSIEEHHLEMAIKELLTLDCDEYDCFEYGWADP